MTKEAYVPFRPELIEEVRQFKAQVETADKIVDTIIGSNLEETQYFVFQPSLIAEAVRADLGVEIAVEDAAAIWVEISAHISNLLFDLKRDVYDKVGQAVLQYGEDKGLSLI